MHLVRSLHHVSIIMLVHKHGGWFDDRYGGKVSHTHTIVTVCHRHQLTSNFNRANLPTTSNCLDLIVIGSASILTTCGPIHLQRALGNHMLPWFWLQRILPILFHDHTQALHLHMSFTIYCIFYSRDSGSQVGSPLILMPKEPTRSNMAPRSLFGIRVFVQRSKIQHVSQTEPKFLCKRMLSLTLWKYGHNQMHLHVLAWKGRRQTLFTTY